MDIPNLFMHLLFEGHVGCFQVFASRNTVAVNIWPQTFFWMNYFIFLGKCLGGELLDQRVGMFNFM